MKAQKGNPVRLKKLFPTGLVQRNWYVKVTLEIKILEGKYTIQSLTKGLSIWIKTFVLPKEMSSDGLSFKEKQINRRLKHAFWGFFVVSY